MMSILGVDGCKAGWLCIGKELPTGSIFSAIHPSIDSLFGSIPRPIVLAIDIPIGLTDAGPRECDRMARALLGHPRSSSVFPAPVRLALQAKAGKMPTGSAGP